VRLRSVVEALFDPGDSILKGPKGSGFRSIFPTYSTVSYFCDDFMPRFGQRFQIRPYVNGSYLGTSCSQYSLYFAI
jgi:hypothetical protein